MQNLRCCSAAVLLDTATANSADTINMAVATKAKDIVDSA